MMNFGKPTIWITALAFILAAPALAQSKKEMKEEIVRLKEQVTQLTTENENLDARNRQLQAESQKATGRVSALESENSALRQELSSKDQAYKLLSSNYEAVQQQAAATQAAVEQKQQAKQQQIAVDPNDKRKCAHYQSKLQAGYSYNEDFVKLNSKGYGLQVYSYYNLCQASEKAEEFKKSYKMYNTYIHVKKDAEGNSLYCVVYGSLKDYDQARTYCENFRKVAPDPIAAGAFVIQHSPN